MTDTDQFLFRFKRVPPEASKGGYSRVMIENKIRKSSIYHPKGNPDLDMSASNMFSESTNTDARLISGEDEGVLTNSHNSAAQNQHLEVETAMYERNPGIFTFSLNDDMNYTGSYDPENMSLELGKFKNAFKMAGLLHRIVETKDGMLKLASKSLKSLG
jgi:hypothetical protein